jgi:hypothetical protein
MQIEEYLRKDAYYITKAYVLIKCACDVSKKEKYSELLTDLEDLTNKYDIDYLEILAAGEVLECEMDDDDLLECADKLVARNWHF